MYQNKTVVIVLCLGISCLWPSRAFTSTLCPSFSLSKQMPRVMFEYLRLSTALDDRSLLRFQSAAQSLVDVTHLISPAVAGEIRAPQSVERTCLDVGRILSNSAKDLAMARDLKDAKAKMSDVRQVIAMWTHLTAGD